MNGGSVADQFVGRGGACACAFFMTRKTELGVERDRDDEPAPRQRTTSKRHIVYSGTLGLELELLPSFIAPVTFKHNTSPAFPSLLRIDYRQYPLQQRSIHFTMPTYSPAKYKTLARQKHDERFVSIHQNLVTFSAALEASATQAAQGKPGVEYTTWCFSGGVSIRLRGGQRRLENVDVLIDWDPQQMAENVTQVFGSPPMSRM